MRNTFLDGRGFAPWSGEEIKAYMADRLYIYSYGLIGFLMVSRARQLGADEAIETDAFFRGLDRESAVDFRRNPDDEFSAI